MLAIIDYGVGNLYSLSHSLTHLGIENVITRDPEIIASAERLILPGVGAFGDARKKLDDTGLTSLIIRRAREGTPLLGICLGMQMLFDKSYEYGEHEGLGLIRGQVQPIAEAIPAGLKIPHIGWNALHIKKESPLFSGIRDGDCVYYVHSYYAAGCDESVIATSEYGAELTGAVQRGNIFGCQFHPEKSGSVGLNILRAFAQL